MDKLTAEGFCSSITGENDPRFRAVTERLGSCGAVVQSADLRALWGDWVQFSGSRDRRDIQDKISKVLKGGFEGLILSVLAHELDLIARLGTVATAVNDLKVLASLVPGNDQATEPKDIYRFLCGLVCHHSQNVALSILAFEGKGLPAVAGVDVHRLVSLLSVWSESPRQSCTRLAAIVALIDNDLGARDSASHSPDRSEVELDAWMSVGDLAKAYSVPKDALRKRLERKRLADFSNDDWKETADRKKGESQYLYRERAAAQVARQLKASMEKGNGKNLHGLTG